MELFKCDICGREIDTDYEEAYEFITKNKASVIACADCLIRRTEAVEKAVAKVNIS